MGAVGLAFLAASLGYQLATPPYEGFDEPHHVAYLERLVRGQGLPPIPGPYFEGHQPPAYYLAGAAVVRALNLPLPPPQRNRAAGQPAVFVYQHTGEPACRACEWILTLRLLRLLTALMGLGTIVLVYLAAREVLGAGLPAAAAAASLAFIPQFDFLHALVNNDGLAFLSCAAVVWGCLVTLAARNPRRRLMGAVIAGAGLGLGLITKEYALALVPLLPAALLVARARLAETVRGVLAWAGVTLLISGAWLLRNLRHYGSPWPFAQERANIGASLPLSLVHKTPLQVVNRVFVGELWRSLWFSGGHGQVSAPAWFYLALLALVLPACAGLVALLTGSRRLPLQLPAARRGLAFLVAALCLEAAAIVYSNLSVQQYQGRYFFPVGAAIGVLLVAGWMALLPRRLARLGALVPPALTLAATTYVLLAVLEPAFSAASAP
jgi:4-amino-4-deoxy-L-arabinose transferase-like glycosyltransferase